MKDLYKELSNKRKELQESKLVPDWYNTSGYQMFVDKYEYNTETSVRGQFERIAKSASKHLTKVSQTFAKEAEVKFFELFWNGWVSPSTPVLANMGTDRGMPVSCSGGVVGDGVYDFYSSRLETAMLTKNGFGTSAYLGNIRARGSKIKQGGKASGVVPVFKMFVQDMRDITQGTARRGAWAGYLELTHGDFDELCDYVSSEPDDANVGWIVTDEFISGMQSGNVDYLRRYQKAMKLKMVLGKGYFFFSDKVNRNRPKMYIDKGLTVKASNLCFTGDTLVATADGRNAVSIKELAEESLGIYQFPVYSSRWNSNKKSWVTEIKNSIAFKTGTHTTIELTLSDGSKFKCTPEHQLALKSGEYIEAQNSVGLELQNFYTSLGGTRKYRHINSTSNGFAKQHSLIWKFYNGSVPNGYHIDHINNIPNDKLENLQVLSIEEHRKKTALEFSGENNAVFKIYDIEANKNNSTFATTLKNNPRYKGLSNIEIYNLALELFTRNIPITIANLAKLDNRMPSSFSKNRFGGSIDNLRKSVESGIFTPDVELEYITPQRKLTYKQQSLTVVNIEFGEIEDVYDLTVEDNHNFNIITSTQDENFLECSGLLVHNCSEITLFADEEHTYTCVLSSMNVAKYDEWKNTDAVYWATIFLDCVAEEFIQKGKNIKGIENAVRFTEKGRALGLGQCGFHTYLQDNHIAFDSLDAMWKNTEIAKHIHDESLKASQWMAQTMGEPEWCIGYGVRNTHRIAIAPTKSTAALMGGVSEGINPDPAMVYTQLTSAGEVERVNPALLKIMKDRKVFNKKTVSELKDKMGSVQHVDWLDEEEKRVFKTAFEINQEVIIRLASQRAKYIDQWQSLNLFFSAEESEAVISKVHQMAFEDESILALYYIYSSSGVQASNGECASCS